MENKHLTPLGKIKEYMGSTRDNYDHKYVIEMLQQYHDYALDMAAGKVELAVIKNGTCDGFCDSYGYTDNDNHLIEMSVNKQSILSLKLTNTK